MGLKLLLSIPVFLLYRGPYLSTGICLYTKLTSEFYYIQVPFKIFPLKIYNNKKEPYSPVFHNLRLRAVMLFGPRW